MRILLIYHFYWPDTVISARLFSELAEELATQGHAVTVYASNRRIRESGVLPECEDWHGVHIQRFARPDFHQGSNIGRLLNSAILQWKWIRAFGRHCKDFDVVIVGTDPQFSWMMFPALRRKARHVKLVHWCFDLYPEALKATGSRLMALAAWLMKPLARRAYGKVDLMADIGECMRGRLRQYGHHAVEATLTPWALEEPSEIPAPDNAMRRKLFGDAKLCFLYSGTVGHAHDIAPFIELARECRRRSLPVGFCFAGYGNRYQMQTAGITEEDTNITLAGFANEDELATRLAAADFHMISLRDGWEGIVVPSKFFGALAMGRPVLFAGNSHSEIADWIRQYGIGYRLTDDFSDEITRLLDAPEQMGALKSNAFKAYQQQFSKAAVLRKWLENLQGTQSTTTE